MRQQLAGGPVQVAEIAAAQPQGLRTRGAHAGGGQVHLERDVDAAAFALPGGTQIGQRIGIAPRTLERGHAERLQRLHRHHPG